MRRPQLDQRDSPELKMTPMIDVVFLLLVFFLWTSSFELPEYDLPSAIAEPPAGGSELSPEQPQEVEAFDEIVIKVISFESQTIVELNAQRLSNLAALESKLSAILKLGVQPPVIIDPEETVSMREAVRVYDVARRAGADRVLFAVRPDGSDAPP